MQYSPSGIVSLSHLWQRTFTSVSRFSESVFVLMLICASPSLRQLGTANRVDPHAITATQMLKGMLAESLIIE
jgi:hypothetical protein